MPFKKAILEMIALQPSFKVCCEQKIEHVADL